MSADRDRIRVALANPVPSIRTPFTRDGGLDEKGLRGQVELLIGAGSQALIVTWGDSLFALLDEREIGEVARIVAAQAKGRAVVAACTGNWSTARCVEFAGFAREVGADVLMTLGASWYPECWTVDSMVAHHAAVARVMPVMANTAFLRILGPKQGLETVRRLAAEVDGVVAAKCDVAGEFDRKAVLLARQRWSLFSGGTKQFHMELHPYGCQGHMSTFLHFRPRIAAEYWSAVRGNDLKTAVVVIERYDFPFFEYISSLPGGFDAGMHGVMELQGVAGRWRRAPFHSLGDADMEKLRGFLQGLGIL